MFYEDDSIQLINCPDEYRYNCKNHNIQCHNCLANKTNNYLKYKPINKNYNKHPAMLKKNHKIKNVSSNSRKGKKLEYDLISKFPLLKKTSNSGATNHDGDAYILLPNNEKITIEIKNRLKTIKKLPICLLPTINEFKESKQQNIDILIIYSEEANKGHCFITYKMWQHIISYLLFTNNIQLDITKYIESDVIELNFYHKDLSNYVSLYYLTYVSEYLLSNKYINNAITNYRNKYGMYYVIDFDTFYTLISIINNLSKA